MKVSDVKTKLYRRRNGRELSYPISCLPLKFLCFGTKNIHDSYANLCRPKPIHRSKLIQKRSKNNSLHKKHTVEAKNVNDKEKLEFEINRSKTKQELHFLDKIGIRDLHLNKGRNNHSRCCSFKYFSLTKLVKYFSYYDLLQKCACGDQIKKGNFRAFGAKVKKIQNRKRHCYKNLFSSSKKQSFSIKSNAFIRFLCKSKKCKYTCFLKSVFNSNSRLKLDLLERDRFKQV